MSETTFGADLERSGDASREQVESLDRPVLSRAPIEARDRPAASRARSVVHLYACLTSFATFVLIIAGALVTSTGSGLAVPDWPLSYGMVMPPMVGGIFYEHGHRMVAGLVAILVFALMLALLKYEPRRRVKLLGVVAFSGVIAQALLGGLTVIFLLPAPISTMHALLGQTLFCLTVLIALATSRSWIEADERRERAGIAVRAAAVRVPYAGLAVVCVGALYVQLFLGAVMRHIGAGLAIPDFPLAFGHLVPPHWSAGIAVHFAHRLWAVVVVSLVLTLTAGVRRTVGRSSWGFTWLASWIGMLIAAQFTLGVLTVLSFKQAGLATAHVATGALLLASTIAMAVLLRRSSA